MSQPRSNGRIGQIILLCCLYLFVRSVYAEDGYRLEVARGPAKADLSLYQGKTLVNATTIALPPGWVPQIKTSPKSTQQEALKAKFDRKNRWTSVTFDQPDMRGELRIEQNGTVYISSLSSKHPVTLHTPGRAIVFTASANVEAPLEVKASEITNYFSSTITAKSINFSADKAVTITGAVHSESDLLIDAHNGDLTNERGRFYAQGNMVLASNKALNLEGCSVLAQGNVTCRAPMINLSAAKLAERNKKRWKLDEVRCSVKKDIVEGPTSIFSRGGTVEFNGVEVCNDGGVIIAAQDVHVTFSQCFANRSITLTQATCPVVHEAFQPGASILKRGGAVSAGGNIILKEVAGKTVDDGKSPPSKPIGVLNTGTLIAQKSLIYETAAGLRFTNGKQEQDRFAPLRTDWIVKSTTSNEVPFDYGISGRWLPMINGQGNVAYTLPLPDAAAVAPRSFSEGCFLDTAHLKNKDLNTAYNITHVPWKASAELEALAVARELLITVGASFPGHGDIINTWRWLRRRSLNIALTTGSLKQVNPGKDFDPGKIALTEQERAELQAELAEINMSHFDPVKFKRLKLMIESGAYYVALNPKAIQRQTQTLLYYTVSDRGAGRRLCIVPVVHYGEEAKKLYRPEGLVQAETVTLAIPSASIYNYGTINGTKVTLNAHNLRNEQVLSERKHVGKRLDRSGFLWSSSSQDVYSVFVPQGGGNIVGSDVDITVQGDQKDLDSGFLNTGGMIVGAHDVNIHACNGSISLKPMLGTHVQEWDPGDTGESNASIAQDFYPGVVSACQGTITLTADKGKILGSATKVVGQNVKLKAKGDLELKSSLAVCRSFDGGESDALSGERQQAEDVCIGRLDLIATNDITLDSSASIKLGGSRIITGGKLFLHGKQCNVIGTARFNTTEAAEEWGFSGFSYGEEEQHTRQEHILSTEISAAQGIECVSDKDNVLNAAVFSNTSVIQLNAGRDNLIQGDTEKTISSSNNWSVGMSFFGSEALVQLARGNSGGAVKALLGEDPLLRSFFELSDAVRPGGGGDGWDKGAASVHSGVEVLRLLCTYHDFTKTGQTSVQSYVGMREGITKNSNFSPSIRIHFEVGSKQSKKKHTVAPLIATKQLTMTSGQDTKLYDVSLQASEKACFEVGRDLLTRPAQETFESTSQVTGFTISPMTFGVGIDLTFAGTNELTNRLLYIISNDTSIHVGRDLMGTGLVMMGKHVCTEVGGTQVFLSVPDTLKDWKEHYALQGSTTGAGGSMQVSSMNKKVVTEQAGIRAGTMELSAQTTSLLGARLTGKGSIAGAFGHWVVPVCVGAKKFSAGASVSFDDAVPAVLEYDNSKNFEHGYVRSAVDKAIVIADTNGSKGLSRNTVNVYKVKAKGSSHIRLALPFINFKKVGATLSDLLTPEDAANKKKFEEAQREKEEKAKAKKKAEEKAAREAAEKAERERIQKERAAQEKARQAEQERAEHERARAQEEAQREQKRRAEQQEREQRNQQDAPHKGASEQQKNADQQSSEQPAAVPEEAPQQQGLEHGYAPEVEGKLTKFNIGESGEDFAYVEVFGSNAQESQADPKGFKIFEKTIDPTTGLEKIIVLAGGKEIHIKLTETGAKKTASLYQDVRDVVQSNDQPAEHELSQEHPTINYSNGDHYVYDTQTKEYHLVEHDNSFFGNVKSTLQDVSSASRQDTTAMIICLAIMAAEHFSSVGSTGNESQLGKSFSAKIDPYIKFVSETRAIREVNRFGRAIWKPFEWAGSKLSGSGAGGATGITAEEATANLGATAKNTVKIKSDFIDPKNIRFSQNSIGKNFGKSTEHSGESLDNLINELKSGNINPENIPPVRIFESSGKMWTLDNRRLYAFQQAGKEIPYRWATPEEVANEFWKFNPINDGLDIKIRN